MGDGEFHRYEVHLASSAHYQGAIIGLRIDPTANAATGAEIRVRSIRLVGP